MDNLLKGNFKVKRPVQDKKRKEDKSVAEKHREKALSSIGGSMVYMEKDKFIWDGDK